MAGAGLMIVNPPWLLDERLRELLPPLHRLLSPDGSAGRPWTGWSRSERGPGSGEFPARPVPEAAHQVIVDHADRLHVGVA